MAKLVGEILKSPYYCRVAIARCFPLRVRILLGTLLLWFLGLYLTALLSLTFLDEQWRALAFATIVIGPWVYFAMALISIGKTVVIERRWRQQWKDASQQYTELCKVISGGLKRASGVSGNRRAMHDAYIDLCREVYKNIPLHPGLFYCHNDQDVSVTRRWAFGTPESQDINQFIGQLVYEGLVGLTQFVDRREALGMAPVRVVASPGGGTIMFLCSLKEEHAEIKWHYVVGVMSISGTGQTAVVTLSINKYYGSKIGQRLREDSWVPSDVSVARKAWFYFNINHWMLVLPFVCILFVPKFLLSLWRRYPFTTGEFRFHLSPHFGELAEHVYIQSVQRPWVLNPVAAAHLCGIETGMKEALHSAIDRTFEMRRNMAQIAN